MTRPLPPVRAKVLAFIDAELKAGRPFPAIDRIADHMGWRNECSALSSLRGLSLDGYLWHSGDGRHAAQRFMRVTE